MPNTPDSSTDTTWERVATCDLCGASLDSADRVPGVEDLRIVQCAHCGLVVTSPRPSPAHIGRFYPPTYYAHSVPAPSRGSRFIGEIKARRGGYPTADGALRSAGWKVLEKAFGGLFLTNLPYAGSGRRLLDVGCGVGEAIGWAESRGWEVYGVELDQAAAAIARARGFTNVHAGTLEDRAYPPAHFDAITLYQTLEHVYSPRAVLQECLRILKPGGRTFVALPNFASLPRLLFGENWNGMQIPVHLYHFDAGTLGRLARDCGFEIEEVRYNARPVAVLTNLRYEVRRAGWRFLREVGSKLTRANRRVGRAEVGLRVSDIMLFVLRRPS